MTHFHFFFVLGQNQQILSHGSLVTHKYCWICMGHAVQISKLIQLHKLVRVQRLKKYMMQIGPSIFCSAFPHRA